MRSIVNSIRKKLCFFSGEDDYIIRECPPRNQFSFAKIGLFVLFVFIGCFASATSFTYYLFNKNLWVGIFLGVFWALMVTNMYLLLLYTVSPTILPTAKKDKNKKLIERVDNEVEQRRVFTPSMIFRTIFMGVLAIIIAQPLNVLFLSDTVDDDLQEFRATYRTNMLIISDSSIVQQEVRAQQAFNQQVIAKAVRSDSMLLKKNVQLLNQKVKEDTRFLRQAALLLARKGTNSERTVQLSNLIHKSLERDRRFLISVDALPIVSSSLQKEFEGYRNSLRQAIQYKLDDYKKVDRLLNRSNFYVKRIQLILSESIVAWLITLSICLIFLLPIYFKFTVRKAESFYRVKKELEDRLVRQRYAEFKEQYSAVFKERLSYYNDRLQHHLKPFIEKLATYSTEKPESFNNQLMAELRNEAVHKYEYWADPPFRHKRRKDHKRILSEKDLLSKLYPDQE